MPTEEESIIAYNLWQEAQKKADIALVELNRLQKIADDKKEIYYEISRNNIQNDSGKGQ